MHPLLHWHWRRQPVVPSGRPVAARPSAMCRPVPSALLTTAAVPTSTSCSPWCLCQRTRRVGELN